jgi:hypothetical protein
MPLRLLAIVLPLIAATALAAAEASLSERINQVATDFEARQDREFKGVSDGLERWRKARLRAAVKDLGDLLDKAASADKPFLAYHLLSVSPRHRPARAVFTGLNIPAPFDEKGVRVAEATVPGSRNRELVEKVSALRYPPFSAVAEVVSPKAATVQSYWKRQRSGLEDLRKQLIAFAAQGQAANAYQVLAYYWPDAKEVVAYYASSNKPVPRQRTWFPSLDRYLLDHGLAGIDCLDTRLFRPTSGPAPAIGGPGQDATFGGEATWPFMENLRNARVEGVFSSSGASTFSIVDAGGSGAALKIGGTALELLALTQGKATPLGKATLDQDLGMVPAPVQFEVRGRSIAALVGGVQVCTGELTGDYAYRRFILAPAGLAAQQLRVRYLSDRDDTEDLLAEAPKVIVPPAEDPWLAERRQQLDKPVTFKVEDTSVEEVVTLLSQISGVKIGLDEKAETLKDLPVTLDGKDLKLSSALDWLQRVSDLTWKPTADGVTLTWAK